jgi:signal transduction histidine kinase
VDTEVNKLERLVSDLQSRNRQLERSNRAMSLLLEILNCIQSADDLETTLRTILNCVTSGYSLGFNRAFLFLLDEDVKSLRGSIAVGPRDVEEAHEIWRDIEQRTRCLEDIVSSSKLGGRDGDKELTGLVRGIEIRMGDGSSLLEQCLLKGEPVVVHDRSSLGESDLLRRLGSDAFVCAPIVTTGRAIGLIVADNVITGEAPTDEQVNLLRALAFHVGQVITNATHLEEIERRLQELSMLHEISKGILSTTDLETDLSLIARISAQVLNARGAVLRLRDDDSGTLITKGMYGVTVGDVGNSSKEGGQAIAEKVAAEGQAVLLSDTKAYTGSDPGLARRRNLICVPLAKLDRVIGTLTVFDKVQSESLGEDGFTADDLRFLTILAGQAAIAIENAKLFDSLKQKQQRIRELHRHLLRSERLAALGELSSQVAHEIRNPLTAIGGFARSIERSMSADDPERASIEVIIKETERLERILTEQLAFAKLSPPEFKPDDINKIVAETVSLFSEKVNAKEATLTTDLADDIPTVSIDADKMKQVFINLLQNALDTIPVGGNIKIRTNRLDRTVEIRFANDGPPITGEILDRLFVPFATTKSGGSGLGLPIAYEIVYEHGGTIDVKSEEGLGTVFLITLPLAIEGERRKGPIDRRSALRDRRRFSRVP